MKREALPRSYRQTARAQAASATCSRIVEAFQKRLNEQWYDEIRLEQIAEDAGVTVQTVVRRFEGKAGLLVEAVRSMVQSAKKRRATPPGDPEGLVRNLVADYERTGDTILRLLALELRHPVLREHLTEARTRHREWVAKTFAKDLHPLNADMRQAVLDALVVATDVYTWKMLRRDMGRGIDATRDVITRMIRSTLAKDGAVEAVSPSLEPGGESK